MRREYNIPPIPMSTMNTIMEFSRLGASGRTAAYYFGPSQQIKNLMERPKGRPQTSEVWFHSVQNLAHANLLVNLYRKRWGLDKAQTFGLKAEDLISVYKSYMEAVQEEDHVQLDHAHNVFSRIRDGSLLNINCKECGHDFVRLDSRHTDTCPFCILSKKATGRVFRAKASN